eukprot:3276202-Amphidinium_carterae.3
MRDATCQTLLGCFHWLGETTNQPSACHAEATVPFPAHNQAPHVMRHKAQSTSVGFQFRQIFGRLVVQMGPGTQWLGHSGITTCVRHLPPPLLALCTQ